MWTWLNENETGKIVFSWVKNFVAVIIAFFIADGADIFAVSTDDLRTWAAAAFAAVLPTVVNYINPRYERYGVGNDGDW
jgi:hypothetical protein